MPPAADATRDGGRVVPDGTLEVVRKGCRRLCEGTTESARSSRVRAALAVEVAGQHASRGGRWLARGEPAARRPLLQSGRRAAGDDSFVRARGASATRYPMSRRQTRAAALGFAHLAPRALELQLLHCWLDSWRGIGDIVVGMHRA